MKIGLIDLRDDFRFLRDVWDERAEMPEYVSDWAALEIVLAILLGVTTFAAIMGERDGIRLAAAVTDQIKGPAVITAQALDRVPNGGGFGGKVVNVPFTAGAENLADRPYPKIVMPPRQYYVDPGAKDRCGTSENPCRSWEELRDRYGNQIGDVTNVHIGPPEREPACTRVGAPPRPGDYLMPCVDDAGVTQFEPRH